MATLCATCGKRFSTQQGLRVHRGRLHGEGTGEEPEKGDDQHTNNQSPTSPWDMPQLLDHLRAKRRVIDNAIEALEAMEKLEWP